MRRLAPVLLLAILAAGCGGSSHKAAPTTTAVTVTIAPPPTTTAAPKRKVALRVYLLREGKVAPVARTVPATAAVGAAALTELAKGPAVGETLTTAIPAGAAFRSLIVGGGLADVRFTKPLPPAAQAQVVYTLTQFPSVQIVRIDGGTKLTRGDFEEQTPQILVESPLPNETVTSPLRMRGTADTFEATFQADVLDSSGNKLASRTITATSGSGQRGTYAASIPVDAPPGPIRLVVYEVSAADSSHLHQVEIPLQLAKG
jgi:hypothetical protein